LDLVTVPALGQLGMGHEESERLMSSIKGALDSWTDGKPEEALPVPKSMERVSRMTEHLRPVVQDVVVPRLPFIVAGIKALLPEEKPAAPPPEPPVAEPQRLAPQDQKDAIKRRAGQTITDRGRLISFPEDAHEPAFATPRAPPAEAAYAGPRPPSNMADARRDTKIHFYGAGESVPGTEPSTSRPTTATAAAPPRAPPPGKEPSASRASAPPSAPTRPAAPASKAPALTMEEAQFILDGVRGQDPQLIEGLIGANMDISTFVLARKGRLASEQQARIKSMTYADLLALGEDLAAKDAAFAQRWRVLMKPKGRAWLKTNFKRIQEGL
jgi:hypothetical protein